MARAAFRIHPDADAVITLGIALELVGSSPEGIRAMRDALASGVVLRAPDRVRVLTAILDLQLDSGALAPAAKTLDELAQLVSDRDGRIAVLTRRAALHDRLGEANQASWDREQVRKLASGAGL
jgi:flavin-binding protein dodecin